ncbi:MAG: hypothetical protein AAFR77_03025, partial [Cyanobacteria bacterium J06631_2]
TRGWNSSIAPLQTANKKAIKIQYLVNRYGETKDMIANISGLACGLIIDEVLERFFPVDSSFK